MDEDWPLTHERHTTNCPAFHTFNHCVGGWPGGRAKSGHQAYRRARFQLERGGADTVGARSEKSERAPPTNHWYATPSRPSRGEDDAEHETRQREKDWISIGTIGTITSQLTFPR